MIVSLNGRLNRVIRYIMHSRAFLTVLLLVNLFGTLYGYIWYIPQLVDTAPVFLIFVPDSPTASLFFTIAVAGWIFGKHFKLIEALALVTLVKYGVWAVAMNLLSLTVEGTLPWTSYMLIVSHGAMALQALLYLGRYQFSYIHLSIAAVWTLHNDVIDYVFGQMPVYPSINQYMDEIGYGTFWLSIGCIGVAWLVVKSGTGRKLRENTPASPLRDVK
ncbi:hypothetical protein AAV35_006190 [Salimicrobium jeotgali]|uniref:DUF1405 domain-containing protein n=1 Tax=Salimicrobium jeotgali TaxID=1230341 RepID=A0AAC8T761_9BACI|nr:DUF1405 domain-containing protein [Salimicrobium jeotgali]AKG05718.1 hypothetical protein AAV35_006190 [Salimicrobium jeotgali]